MPLDTSPYDALLLVSFGGPEKPEDVVPFLENVTRGRGIPRERLEEVGEHYFAFGGRSPINDQNRAFIAAVEEDLPVHRHRPAGLLGQPQLGPVPRGHAAPDAGRRGAPGGLPDDECLLVVLRLPAVPREPRRGGRRPWARARPRLDRLRHYFNHPGFVEPMVDATLSALADLGDAARRDAHVLFVTHSVPESMNATAGPDGGAYVAQHRAVADEVGERVRQETGHRYPTELVFCSRSGPPHVPWLEPDVNDRIEELAEHGVAGVVVVPIGFVSDHMEVIYDLDTEASATAEKVGVEFVRASTAGLDPRFVAMVRDLLLERAAAERGAEPRRPSVGSLGPSWDLCPVGCCPNARGDKPALCGRD